MPTTPEITGAVRGIDQDLTGYVLRNVKIHRDFRQHRVPDQKDRTGYEEVIEHTWRLSFTAISDGASTSDPPLDQDDYIIFPSTGTMGESKWRWQVDTCEDDGTYNDDHKWSVTAHRTDNWPGQTENWTPRPSQSSSGQGGSSSSGQGGSSSSGQGGSGD